MLSSRQIWDQSMPALLGPLLVFGGKELLTISKTKPPNMQTAFHGQGGTSLFIQCLRQKSISSAANYHAAKGLFSLWNIYAARKWKQRCQNVCLMQCVAATEQKRVSSLSPAQPNQPAPPDMSTLVKSWPYRELYGLIRAPLRWDRARHVFVRGVVRHREEEAGMRRSLHQFGQPFSFGGQPPQAIAYLTCKATTKRGGVVPKVNCRIWGVGGRFEITSWGEIAAGKNYCRPPFRARNWGDCKKLEPVRLHETHLLQRVDIQSILFWWIPPLNWLHVDHSDGSLPFHHLPMVSYHRKPLKTMLQWLPLWSNYR